MTKGNRQIQAKKTKQRIFNTALELFEKKGFNHVSVDEIVKKSKSSKGAFYGHFHSKYGIFLEKFKEIDSFYESFVKTIPDDLSFKEKIMRLIEGQMHYLENDLGIDLMRTVYMSGLIENEENFFANTDRSIYKIIQSYMIKAVEDGEIKEDIPVRETTMFISRCMRGTLYDWIAFGKGFQLHEESRKYFSLFLDGVLKNYGINE